MAHIPSGNTAELEVLTFQQALEAANTPSQEYDIEKWLYAPNFYSEYRYILGTRGNNPLICIGINPSTAQAIPLITPDNIAFSVEFPIAFSENLGSIFGSFDVFLDNASSCIFIPGIIAPPRNILSFETTRYR